MTFDTEYWKYLDEKIPGWLSEEEARFLVDNTVAELNARYLEIGIAYGKSMRVIAQHFPHSIICGIDKINHGVDRTIKEEFMTRDIFITYGDSNVEFKEHKDHSIDTLFIDGDHTYEGCFRDILNWYNKVRSGGRIIFHDYGRKTKEHEGVTQAVDIIRPFLDDFKSANCISCGTKK